MVVQSSTLLRYSDIISEEIKRVETKVHHVRTYVCNIKFNISL